MAEAADLYGPLGCGVSLGFWVASRELGVRGQELLEPLEIGGEPLFRLFFEVIRDPVGQWRHGGQYGILQPR